MSNRLVLILNASYGPMTMHTARRAIPPTPKRF
jgi:hypothetical protein